MSWRSKWGTVWLALVMASVAALALVSPVAAQQMCAACHSNTDMLARLAGDSAAGAALFIDPEHFGHSVHAERGFQCTTCHGDVQTYPHGDVAAVNCGTCHRSEQADLSRSIHGTAYAESGEIPATCADCHTAHDILHVEDPDATVYRMTQFEICATCHSDPEHMGRFGQDNVQAVRTYLSSVHARGLVDKGLSIAPVCTDCHGNGEGAHRIVAVSDTASHMNREHVAESCGRCHVGIKTQWLQGIHGSSFAAGNRDVPTCTNCHGEHAVQAITNPASTVYPTHVAQTCTACHDREELNDRYDLPTSRGRTFQQSFHGVALAGGQMTVANCESCHGAHGILPSSNPRSRIYPANLVTTCGGCHPGIGSGVAQGKIHVASVRQDIGTLAWWVQAFYFAIIGGIVLYGAALIALDQYRHRVVDPRREGHHA